MCGFDFVETASARHNSNTFGSALAYSRLWFYLKLFIIIFKNPLLLAMFRLMEISLLPL